MKLQNEVQTLRNQPVHIVTFACKIPFRIKKIPIRIMRIMWTGISALTKVLDSTPHGGGPDPYCHAL